MTPHPDIRLDDLGSPEIARFLEAHLEDMRSVSPPESKHALDLEGLRADGIRFWTLYENGELAGCIALKRLDALRGEVKSMRVDARFRGRGVGRQLLRYLVEQAHADGLRTLLLETGSMKFFEPARKLYESFGFGYCGPFADYVEDPNSVFMMLQLQPEGR